MKANKPSWQSSHFTEQDTDPLAGFANIMDVMLVFSLGLMLALVAQSPDLQERLNITAEKSNKVSVTTGDELVEIPEEIKSSMKGKTDGMMSLGQVYKDPKTGKLILISGN